eukprot:TRINITY_DN5155_c0_g1_i2.p1 TRINITY_DN5155_c0_g1~~TRINITY_DN5155_c0_g1_i2.p1  ORF type:complete len:158 (-),score=43.70 TRINITY_DN5155_c0_g1_i2:85-558(-)
MRPADFLFGIHVLPEWKGNPLQPSGCAVLSPVWFGADVDEDFSMADEIAGMYGMIRLQEGIFEVYGNPQLVRSILMSVGFTESHDLVLLAASEYSLVTSPIGSGEFMLPGYESEEEARFTSMRAVDGSDDDDDDCERAAPFGDVPGSENDELPPGAQ